MQGKNEGKGADVLRNAKIKKLEEDIFKMCRFVKKENKELIDLEMPL